MANLTPNLFCTLMCKLAIGISLTGCSESTVNSDDVPTRDTHANFQVTAGSSGDTYVNVELKLDGPASNTSIELSHNDQLWISNTPSFTTELDSDNLFSQLNHMATNSRNLDRGGVFRYGFLGFRIYGDTWYSSLITDSGDSTYYLSFVRENFENAHNSQVTLPPVFAISAPLPNESHSRSNPLTINWQSDDTAMPVSISVFTTCIDESYDEFDVQNIQDAGSYTLAAEDFTPDATGTCNTSIEVVKSQLGQIDPLFNSGLVVGNRVAKVTIITND